MQNKRTRKQEDKRTRKQEDKDTRGQGNKAMVVAKNKRHFKIA